MAVELANLIRAQGLFTGPLGETSAGTFDYGIMMQAVGIKKMVRIDVGQYIFCLISPVELDVIPDPGEVNRPPFCSSLAFGEDYGLAGNTVACGFVPSDIPLAPGDDPDMLGGVFVKITDADGNPTDVGLFGFFVMDFPNNGAGGAPGEWPQIIATPGTFPV